MRKVGLKNLSILVMITTLVGCSVAPKKSSVHNGSKQNIEKGPSGSDGNVSPGTDVPNTIDGPEFPSGLGLEPLALIMGPAIKECDEFPQLNASPALRLLTNEEYQNTLVDVLGVKADYRLPLPPELSTKGYLGLIDTKFVTDALMDAYIQNAYKVSGEILESNLVATICNTAIGEICADKIISELGPKLWRKPVEAIEKQKLIDLYKASATPSESMTNLFAGMLISGNFLYRSEIGKTGKLNAYERASALSYFFWKAPPDDELRGLAASQELLKDDVLKAQARRLLESPRARAGIDAFTKAYTMSDNVLSVSKDQERYKSFTQSIKQSLDKESKDSVDYWIRTKNAKFAELYTADATVGGNDLASYYGVPTSKDSSVTLLNHSQTGRRGILGFASVLSSLATNSETHPVKRGDYVMDHLLCEKMIPTPQGLEIKIPEKNPNLTTRERFKEHSSNPVCAGCHRQLDGAGFGMEDYDAVGLFRAQDEGKNVDVSGTIYGVDEKDLPFEGVRGLSKVISTSIQGQRCLAVHVYQLARGKQFLKPSTDSTQLNLDKKILLRDVCVMRKIADDFTKDDLPIKELLIRTITHPYFMNRGL